MSLSLVMVMAVHGKLPQECNGNRIGAIALLRFWQPGSFNLPRAQGHVAHNPTAGFVNQNGDARRSADVIDPGMALEPRIKRWPAAIERCAVITLGQGPRRQNRHAIWSSLVWSDSVLEARDFFCGLADPGLELFPAFGGNRHHRPAKHINLSRLQSLPAHEVA